MEQEIAIIGMGRMGGLLTAKLSPHYRLKVWDRNSRKIDQMVRIHTAEALDGIARLKCETVIAALPDQGVLEVAGQLKENGFRGILINIATSLPRREVEKVSGMVTVVSAKFIGHYQEIKGGEPPLIVVDSPLEAAAQKVLAVMSKIGPAITGPEEWVTRLNRLASRAGIRAAIALGEEMRQEDLPLFLWETAVRNVCAGTMRAYAAGDIGPFAQKIVQELTNPAENE